MENKQAFLTKLTLALSIILLLISSCNKQAAKIKIQLSENADKNALIEEQRVAGSKFIDSVKFSHSGKLSYQFDLKQITFINIAVEDTSNIFLLLQPGDRVQISDGADGMNITGSEDSKKLNELYSHLFAVRDSLNEIKEKFKLSVDESYRETLSEQYSQIVKNHYKFSQNFILENLTSLVSLAALYQEIAPSNFVFGRAKDLQFYKIVSDSLKKYYPKHRHVLALERNFKTMMDSYKFDQLINSPNTTTTDLFDVVLPDQKGNQISMLNSKARYVLLNVWSPKDQTSSKIFPAMRSIYSTHKKSGFEIYNVYVGKSVDEWQKSVKFEEITSWTNVADTSFPNSNIQMQYNIRSLPTNYLIDVQEKLILARNLTPDQLNKKLHKLFD